MTDTSAKTSVERFSLARLRVAIDWPQLAPAVWALGAPVPVLGLMARCGGAIATDTCWRVYYDPEAIAPFTTGQLAAALVHEAWHCLRRHGRRAAVLAVEPRWRAALAAALDCEVNGDMERCVPRPQWAYRVCRPEDLHMRAGLPFEAYYPAAQNVLGPCTVLCVVGGSSMDGAARAWEQSPFAGVGPAEQESVCRAVATSIGCAPGTMPGGWVRWALGVLAPPRVPWQQVFARLVRAGVSHVSGAVDYTRQVPSRRQAVTRVLLPTLRRPVCVVDVLIDSSGSMGAAELRGALAEADGIIKASGAAARIYVCDMEVHGGTQRVRHARDVEIRGGGGTDMGAGIAFAASRRPRADVLTVLTDGFSPWGGRPAIAPVIVVLVGTQHASPSAIPPWAHSVEVSP